MKRILCPLLGLFACSLAHAQTKATWGEEFKMHNGSTDLAMLSVDKTGEYLEESHDIKSIGLWSPNVRKSSTLVKLTPTLSELYRNDFDKELKGKQFERFFFIGDKLYLFASDYSKHDRLMFLYASEVDKSTGHLKQEWKQVYQWQKDDKSENLAFKIVPNSDSTKVILTATFAGKGNNRYELQALDGDLKPLGKPMTITNEFDPKTFQIEDFVYTPTGNAVVVGRLYEYEDGKSKKDKNLLFKTYSIRVYDLEGKLVKDIVTDVDGKFLVTSKVLLLKNELVLAAFYSNTKKKKEINGLLVQRIDPATGNILVSTQKELNAASITQVDEDEDDKKEAKAPKGDDEDGLVANLRFNKFYLTPDNGVVILAEKYKRTITTSSSTTGGGMGFGMGSTTQTTTANYECGDIYMSKISAAGNIDWLHVVPKNQRESLLLGESSGPATGIWFSESYFSDSWNYPFFAGFGSIAGQNHLHIFFNDYEKNAAALDPGTRIKRVYSFGRTSCYEVNLDMVTGKYTKKEVFSNKDIPNAMPRLGVEMDNTLYMTGKESRTFGKARVAVGKLVCKD